MMSDVFNEDEFEFLAVATVSGEEESNVVSLTGEAVDVPEMTAAERKPRNKWTLDGDFAVCTATDGSADRFPLSSLPEAAKRQILFMGLTVLLGRYDDMGAAFDRLVSGEVPQRKTKAVKIDNWRQAIARALVEVMKKSGNPVSLDDAMARAARLSASEVRSRKTDVNVVKHYGLITKRTSSSLADLLAA